MVELGLLRAQAPGMSCPSTSTNSTRWRGANSRRGELTPGDIGLMLWIDARRDGGAARSSPTAWTAALAANGGLGARLGMELGWIVTGLAHHVAPAAAGPAVGFSPKRSISCSSTIARRARCSVTSATPAGDDASRTSPRRSTPCWPWRWSRATVSTIERCPPRSRPRTALLECSYRMAAGRGCSMLSAAPSSSATRSIRSIRTRWRRWRCSSSGRPVATSATSTRSRTELGLDPRRQRVGRGHGRPRERARPALDSPARPDQPLLGRSQDGRIARRRRDTRIDRALTETQPNRPPVSLRLGARGLVRTRGRPRPDGAATRD